jgi:hypothetical protein
LFAAPKPTIPEANVISLVIRIQMLLLIHGASWSEADLTDIDITGKQS